MLPKFGCLCELIKKAQRTLKLFKRFLIFYKVLINKVLSLTGRESFVSKLVTCLGITIVLKELKKFRL